MDNAASLSIGDRQEDSQYLSQTMGGLTLHPQHQQLHPAQHDVKSLLLSPPTTSRPLKRLRFGFVTIRNYDMTMGDNPSVTSGPPVTLNWSYEEIPPMPIREFEKFRIANPGAVDSHCLMVSAEDRRAVLKRAGFTDNQIQLNEKRVMKIQKQRARTRMSLPFQRVEHALQSAGRKLQRSRQSQKAFKFTGKYPGNDVCLPDASTVTTETLSHRDDSFSLSAISTW